MTGDRDAERRSRRTPLLAAVRARGRSGLDTVTAVGYGAVLAWRVYHPPREPVTATPADEQLTSENWSWRTTRDGVPVRGWFVPGRGPGAVVVCHGMGRTRASVLPHVRRLHEAGFSVLAYDLRNHGVSGGDWRSWDMAERYTADLLDAVGHVRADPRVPGRVGVLAFSFSTWPAVHATRRAQAGIDAVVCESGPVADIGSSFGRLAALRALTLPRLRRTPLAESVFVATARLAGLGMLAVRGWPPTADGCPLLLVGGGRDRILPGDTVADLARSLPGTRSWTVPRATHVRALNADPAGWDDVVVGFLREHLHECADAAADAPTHEAAADRQAVGV